MWGCIPIDRHIMRYREVRVKVMRIYEYLFDKKKGKSKKKKKREREMRGMSFEKIPEVWGLKNEFFK